MLGGFDAYLLGYHDRSLALPGRFARRVRAGGMIRPAVVADGMVVGTWRQRRRGTTLAIVVEPFGRLTRGIRAGIEAECADLGRFLAAETTLTIADTAPSARTNA